MAWLVLTTLMFFSLVSWAIIFHKARRFKQAEQDSTAFLKYFRSANRFADVVTWTRKHPNSPLARLFNAGYQEIRYQSHQDDDDSGRLLVSNMEAVGLQTRLRWN